MRNYVPYLSNPPFVGEAQHKAHCGSEGALCRPNDLLKVAERLRAERLRKFKKTMKRGDTHMRVALNIVVLSVKNPSAERLSALPLAFGLCRSAHAQARALQANNRPDFFPFIPRSLRRHIGYKGAGSGQ